MISFTTPKWRFVYRVWKGSQMGKMRVKEQSRKGKSTNTLEILSHLRPTRQENNETTSVSCPFRDSASYLFYFPAFWLASGGVRPVSCELPLQSPMTDLKDSSLSPLLQITSSDMFGHADNVLSENSFQGWMGYKLSTPRVGYFFNCCFIPLKREGKWDQREREREIHRAQARLGLSTAQ